MIVKRSNVIPLKTCTGCREVFPATLDFFYKNDGGGYGVTPKCKTCTGHDNKKLASDNLFSVTRSYSLVKQPRWHKAS